MKKYIQKHIKNGRLSKSLYRDNLKKADDLIYKALDLDDRKERIKLAKKALSISKDCVDAYIILAQEYAESIEEKIEFYQKGVEAGERSLGEEMFKNNTGYFWGIIETRPYMRAKLGLAQCLWLSGRYDESLSNYYNILKLNPNDNQGVRYLLAIYLAEIKKYDDLEKFLNSKEYKDDIMAEWLWTKLLLSYVRSGDSIETNSCLKKALEANHYVADYLTGRKKVPQYYSDCITIGGEDEARCYVLDAIDAWKKVDGLIEWLKDKTSLNENK
ncbi:MAG: hypothetical protein KA059_08750 [Elusimicrobiales bacterium]|nr:hypothetical protein [Elusimicrobiales bacterium]